MGFSVLMNSDIFTYLVIPLLIFLARIVDVSLGTIRMIFIAKGFKYWAPLLGFFEVLIWLVAIRKILVGLPNPLCFIAYAAGFAMGTYVGIRIEEKLSVGKVLVRIHIKKGARKLLDKLLRAHYPVVSFNAENHEGRIKVLSIVVKRQSVPKIMQFVNQFDTHVVYSIEDVRYAIDEYVPGPRKRIRKVFKPHRKGK